MTQGSGEGSTGAGRQLAAAAWYVLFLLFVLPRRK